MSENGQRPDGQDQVSATRRLFDDWARRGRALGMERAHGPTALQALERVDLPEDGAYLDIGCGSGYTVRWAAELLPRGQATGIDVSPEMIATARALASGYDNTRFIEGGFPGVDLPAGTFDAIFTMEVFYYLPDLDGALAEACRLLRPGGVLACVVDYYEENPDSHGWPEELGVALDLRSMAGWKDAFRGAGLEVVEQARIRLSPDEASEDWKVSAGSLLTLGRRPRDHEPDRG